MPFTTPPDKSSGEIVTETNWDTHIKANLDYLYSPPMCKLEAGTAWAIPGELQAISFGTAEEVFDTDSMHGTTNPTRITFQTAGKYMVMASGGTVGGSSPVTLLYLNGNAIANVAADSPGKQVIYLHDATVSDYVEVKLSIDGTASVPSLSAHWIGA